MSSSQLAKKNSWKNWCTSRQSSTNINKKFQDQLFQNFDASVAKETVIQRVKNNDELVYLFRQSEDSIGMFHHLQTSGGTIMASKESAGFIVGVEEGLSCFLKPNIGQLCEKSGSTTMKVPTPTSMLQVSSRSEVAALAVGSTSTFAPRNFIPVVPFMIDDISKALLEDDEDMEGLFVKIVQSIKTFDTLHSSDQEYVDKAKSKAVRVLSWLWLVIQNTVQVVPNRALMDKDMIEKLQAIEDKCLGVNQTQSGPLISPGLRQELRKSFTVMAASSAGTKDALQKLAHFQDKANERESKSFKKLPEATQHMLLVASSRGDIVPPSLSPEAEKFFHSSSVTKAREELNSRLNKAQLDCTIPTSMANSLLNGVFKWENSTSPSGFCCSTISSMDVMEPDTLHDSVILDNKLKFELDQTTCDKISKHNVVYPNEINEMIEHFEALGVLSTLFFGPLGELTLRLEEFVEDCKQDRRLLKRKLETDHLIIAKLMVAVDDRINTWLEECKTQPNIKKTTLKLLYFSSMIEKLKCNEFIYTLPKSIARAKRQEKGKEKSGEKAPVKEKAKDELNSEDRKRLKYLEDKKDEFIRTQDQQRVRNHNQKDELKLKDQKEWDKVFRKKSGNGKPLSDGSHPCLKFFVKGFCYTNCYFGKSHRELSPADEKIVCEYVKDLRSQH